MKKCQAGDRGRHDVQHEIVERDPRGRCGWACRCGDILFPTDAMVFNGFPPPETKPNGKIVRP